MKEKYIPGEGCQCSARCSCECGCDVDWTPREVYELREQREEARDEIKKLKREVINWKTAHDIAIEQCDSLLEEREQWRMSSVCRKLVEQRDRLAEELKEAQNAIEMMLRDSSCRRIPAYTEEQLAAVKGGSHDH